MNSGFSLSFILMLVISFLISLFSGIMPFSKQEAEVVPVLIEEAPAASVPSDEGLTLLVDYCHKTVATVGGDGYREVVLYRDDRDGSYQVHTYVYYEYMDQEEHLAYRADESFADAVWALIEENQLTDLPRGMGLGLSGAEEICKFITEDGVVHRITADDLPYDQMSLIYDVQSLLYSAVIPENAL